MSFEIGIGKVDITGPVAGQNFMGYVHTPQIGSGLNDRLYCRAFYFSPISSTSSSENILLVHTDLMSISLRLRQRIISILEKNFPDKIRARNVVIHSQHTHSGPGGLHPDYVYYFASLGFALNHFDLMTNRIIQCIEEAMLGENKFYGDVLLSRTQLFNVGRNRSPEAFDNNPKELKEEFLKENIETKRTIMTILRLEDNTTKQTKGVLSFFPIHTTSLNREAHMVSADNKGFAQYLVETRYKGIIAAFFQTEAGDVSPNMADDMSSSKKHFLFKHEHEDYVESCEVAGKYQAEGVFNALDGKLAEIKLESKLGGRLLYYNYGKECPGVGGISSLAGTEDGRGILCLTEGLNEKVLENSYSMQLCSKLSHYLSRIAVSLPFQGRGQSYEFVGWKQPMRLRSQKFSDFITKSLLQFEIDIFRKTDKSIDCQRPKVLAADTKFLESFVPGILPLQVLQLGSLIIPTMPFEVTSMAGHLIRKALKRNNPQAIVEILPISNGYAQYLATESEFDAQHYEGASTLFGRAQLESTISNLERLFTSLNRNNSFGTLSEEAEFMKEIDRSQEQAFDDGKTSFLFDEVMHSAISHIEVSPEPYLSKMFPLGSVLYDVPMKGIDLLDRSPRHRRKISATFRCVFPGNSQKLITSFCDVERKDGTVFLKDNDWNVRFVYRTKYFFLETCTCEWLVHNTKEHFDIVDDFYRLTFNGVYEKGNSTLEYFSGSSSFFRISNGDSNVNFSDIGRLSGDNVVKEYQNYVRDELLLIMTIAIIVLVRCFFCCFSNRKQYPSSVILEEQTKKDYI